MNLTPIPEDKTRGRYKSKSGWVALIMVELQHKCRIPMYNAELYTVGGDPENDLVLPFNDDWTQLIIDVTNPNLRKITRSCACDAKFQIQVIFRNVSSPASSEDILVNDNILKINQQLIVDLSLQPHVDLKIGPFKFVICRTRAPGYKDLIYKLASIAKCFTCGQAFVGTHPLPCGHTVCDECFPRMVRNTSARITELLRAGSVAEEVSRISAVKCPTCEFPVPYAEMIKIKRESLLLWLTKLIPPLYRNSQLYCADCDNVRCIVSLTDFWKCSTCECYCCPLCVRDLHRNHQLRSVFDITTENFCKHYQKKSVFIKEYKKLLFVTTSKGINSAENRLSEMEDYLEEALDSVDSILLAAKSQYIRLVDLESVQNSNTNENDKNICVELFEAMILSIGESLQVLLKNLNRIANVINETGANWTTPKWCNSIVIPPRTGNADVDSDDTEI